MASSDFDWPWQYNFAPFFTLQPNADTRRQQLSAWCTLVLNYCSWKKIYSLNLADLATSEPFSNRQLGRQVNAQLLRLIFDELAARGNVEWQDKSKSRCLVHWKTPDQWAKLVYAWAAQTGHLNTVCTLYELTDGEDTVQQPFYGLEKGVLLRALRVLQQNGQAEIIDDAGIEGVKFFS